MGASDPESESELEQLFPGSSSMALRLREFDWSASELGPPRGWPEALRSALRIFLRAARGGPGAERDAAEHPGTEQALRESEERFRVAIEASAVGFSLLRAVRPAGEGIADFEWLYANAAAVRLIGNPLEQLIGRRVSAVLPDLWREQPDLFAALIRVVETGEPHDVEVHSHASGAELWTRNILAKLGDGIAAWTMDQTERKRIEDALREADRRKDAFVATLAHELRNPLAPIRQAAAVTRMPRATPAQIRWSHEVIERQAQRMALLLDDLLDVSRIGRGRLQLRKISVDLGSVIDAALEPVRPLIEERGHALTLDVPAAAVWIEADPLRLSQVVSNLLSNAAKYTEPGGKIRLSASREGDQVVVRVADDGIGLRPEAAPRIFEMFSQVSPEPDRSGGGLGIGLALSKGLVELHGGSIAVHSDGPGRGSEFSVRIPIGSPRLEAAREAPGAEREGNMQRRRVLVADDNRDAARSLALLLELQGCEVRTAFDGEQAFAVAACFHPELALLDIGMPRLSGYELAARIRAQPWGRGIALIAVSGWGQERDKRRSTAVGFDHHLTKPIDPDRLQSLLSRAR